MLLDNYQIVCTKYVWNSNVSLTAVNVFSHVAPISTETFDVKDYLIDLDTINWTFENTVAQSNVPIMFFETSDVKYRLMGFKNSEYLVDFFGLYRDTSFEKHIITIQDITTGVKIHHGIVSQELIEETLSLSEDSKIIDVTALGFEKEFKAYYQNQQLPDSSTQINWNEGNIARLQERNPFNERAKLQFNSILNQIFNSPLVSFGLEDDVSEWQITRDPYLGLMKNNQGMRFIKSSYERIQQTGCSRYDWLVKTCNSMGWVFYFYNDKFYIKNRISVSPNPVTLDYKKINEITLSKISSVIPFDHVILLDGAIESKNNAGNRFLEGARFQIFSQQPNSTNEMYWDSINNSSWLVTTTDGLIWQRFSGEDSLTWNYLVEKHTTGFPANPIINNVVLQKKDILGLDCGDTGDNAFAYNNSGSVQHINTFDIDAGGNYPTTFNGDAGFGDGQIVFKGNFGSALFKQRNDNELITYQDFVKTTTFSQNFMKFFNMDLSRKMKIKYNDIITNPLDTYIFINDNGVLAGTWSLVSMSVNLKDKESELELQLLVN